MIIHSHNKTKTFEDYDFMFVGGIGLPVTLDPAAGDTITFESDHIRVFLAKRVNPTDESILLPSE